MQLGKKTWVKPEIRRISAGSAEQCNGKATGPADGTCTTKS